MDWEKVAFYGLVGILILYALGSESVQGVIDQSIGRVIKGGAYIGGKAVRAGKLLGRGVSTLSRYVRR